MIFHFNYRFNSFDRFESEKTRVVDDYSKNHILHTSGGEVFNL